jgi:hypothetical protein
MSAEVLRSAAVASQVLFIGTGLVLLWQQILSPAARARHPGPALGGWFVPGLEAAQFLFHGLGAGFLLSFFVGLFAKPLGIQGDALTISATAALHFGALLGFAGYIVTHRDSAPSLAFSRPVILSGLATFLVAMPVVFVVNLAWLGTLKLIGVEVVRQPAVEMVSRLGGSPWFALFIASAVLFAPAAEELFFRAGLFRFLRLRRARLVALVVPAALFAAIHFHVPSCVPLAVLGIVFALAYERTGHIGTPIVAHAAFNLNNLLMLLAGVDR